MKKNYCSLLSIMCLGLMVSCDKTSTSASNSVLSNDDVEKQYVEYKAQDDIHTLKTSKDDSTYILEKNDEVIYEGSYLKSSDDTVILKITEENIIKNFITTIDAEGHFKSSILDYASLDKKDISNTYDTDYGFGNSQYVVGKTIIETYDYVNLYKNGIYELISKESITSDKILSITYGNYTLENDVLSLEDTTHIINDNYAWSVSNDEGNKYDPELIKQCKISYTLFDSPQTITINNQEMKDIKGYIWSFIKKDSIYIADFDRYKEDTVCIELSNGMFYFITDFEMNESTITLKDCDLIINL